MTENNEKFKAIFFDGKLKLIYQSCLRKRFSTFKKQPKNSVMGMLLPATYIFSYKGYPTSSLSKFKKSLNVWHCSLRERGEYSMDILPEVKLMGDTAYGAAKNLNYLAAEKNIEPHIPVWDKSSRKDDTLCRDDFVFIEEEDQYLCPEGKRLSTTGKATSDNGIIYRSRNLECVGCPLKEKCCPNTPNRKITRSVYEKSREIAREITKGDVYRDQSRAERKKVEMLFAHMKRNLRFDRLDFEELKVQLMSFYSSQRYKT